jgi:hypothetical protein
MTVEWRPVEGFSSYEVSNVGTVRTWRRRGTYGGRRDEPQEIKARLDRKVGSPCPYLSVNLWQSSKMTKVRVHILVLRAFHGVCPDGKEGAHLDGDYRNNTADNLAWVTHEENCQHRILHGTQARGTQVFGAKLNDTIVAQIRADLIKGEKGVVLARRYGVAPSVISVIRHGKSWAGIAPAGESTFLQRLRSE